MKKYNIAILGATGAVGRTMIRIIEEYNIPVGELRLLASAKSEGMTESFRGEKLVVHEAKENSFFGMDFVLGAVSAKLSRFFAPAISLSGAVYIDNSSAFRHDPDVPLVVPEINGEDALNHSGVIANPNCSTIITLMAIAALAKRCEIVSINASTYQAVSGAGQAGIDALEAEEQAISRYDLPPRKTIFPMQIIENVIPHIGDKMDNGYTTEEMKMQNEGRKILHLPQLTATCTCVRVPVFRSHSISLTVRCAEKIEPDEANRLIAACPGVRLVDDIDGRDYPTPLDTTGQDLVYVGRVRRDLTDEKGLVIWCCGDQLRKGAAANAVQIMKYLIEHENV